MTQPIELTEAEQNAISALTLLRRQSVTITQSGSRLRIACDNFDDANTLFAWLESIVDNPHPCDETLGVSSAPAPPNGQPVAGSGVPSPALGSTEAHSLPSTTTHETRILSVGVLPKGQPIFSELACIIGIDDEAAGEFVWMRQNTDGVRPDRVAIDVGEWAVLRDAIEFMVGECRDAD